MLESELEMRKLGIPVKTRHNEVAPAQYEIAPMFENSNVGSDHQQLLMRMLENVARRYGLVCLLHEKPFAGVNGSGKHNNWSMGTDTGSNLLNPGDTPADNIHFLFFCAAVIQAVNKHQGLLRASVANIGQDHRLGANEAPPAIISIFLGAELEKVFEAIASGEGDPQHAGLLPRPRGDGAAAAAAWTAATATAPRRSPSPATNSSSGRWDRACRSPSRTPCSTRSSPRRSTRCPTSWRRRSSGGMDAAEAVIEIVKESYLANKEICFSGDNYSEEWHAEAERRGLKNLKTTPDALLEVIADDTIAAFEKYSVLSKRELESRFEVWIEQYALRANIEAETTFSIAKTMILPAALRHLALISEAGVSCARGRGSRPDRGDRDRARRAREGQCRADRAGGPGAGALRPRRAAGHERHSARGGRQAGEGRRRRSLAAAEVRGDAVHQVGEAAMATDGTARKVAIAIAAGRFAIGAGALLRARPALRALGFPETDAAGRSLAQLAGGRDLALAALVFAARNDRTALRAATMAGAAVDAGDAVTLGLAGRGNEELKLAGVAGLLSGGSAALAGIWAWRQLQA